MSYGYRLISALKIMGLILVLATSIGACAGLSGPSDSITSWKEEVLLHDGSKVIVSRTAKRFGRHEIGQQPPIGEQSLSFTLPSTNEKIIWEDKFANELGSANFLPMLLDVINGTAYLVTNPMGCLSYNKWGRPNPPYVVFKYQHNEWQRILLEELPDQIGLPNLILSSPDTVVKKLGRTIVSADVIQQIISRYPQSEYKTILRKPMAKSWCQVLNPSPKAPLPMVPIQEK